MSDLLDDSPKFNSQNTEIRRADFGSRLGAHLLDSLFSLIIMVIVIFSTVGFDTAVLVDFLENIDDPNTIASALPFVSYLSWLLIAFSILYASLEALTGASVGKRLVGLQIGTQDARTAEVNVYLSRALLKHFNIVLSILSLSTGLTIFSNVESSFGLFFLISCLFALGQDRLALHDKITGTAVYKKGDLDR